MAGESIVGFELGEGQQDPFNAENPPTIHYAFFRPCTYHASYTTEAGLVTIDDTWSHKVERSDGSFFGGDRSLRLGIGDYALIPGALWNAADVFITCGDGAAGGSTAFEVVFWMRIGRLTGFGLFLLDFHGPGESYQGSIWIEADGTATVLDSTAWPPVATGSVTLPAAGEECEIRLILDLTGSGSVTLKVDGNTAITGSGDFAGGSGPGLVGVDIGIQADVDNDILIHIDDFCAFPTGVLTAEPKVVLGSRPTIDYVRASTPSAGSVAADVVDEDAVSVADYTSFSGLTLDLYHMDDISEAGRIWAVSAVAHCRSSTVADDWDARLLQSLGPSTSTSTSDDIEPSDSEWRSFGRCFTTAPGGGNWSLVDVNASTSGLEVTNVGSSGALRLAWFGREVLMDVPEPVVSTLLPPDARTYHADLC